MLRLVVVDVAPNAMDPPEVVFENVKALKAADFTRLPPSPEDARNELCRDLQLFVEVFKLLFANEGFHYLTLYNLSYSHCKITISPGACRIQEICTIRERKNLKRDGN